MPLGGHLDSVLYPLDPKYTKSHINCFRFSFRGYPEQRPLRLVIRDLFLVEVSKVRFDLVITHHLGMINTYSDKDQNQMRFDFVHYPQEHTSYPKITTLRLDRQA